MKLLNVFRLRLLFSDILNDAQRNRGDLRVVIGVPAWKNQFYDCLVKMHISCELSLNKTVIFFSSKSTSEEIKFNKLAKENNKTCCYLDFQSLRNNADVDHVFDKADLIVINGICDVSNDAELEQRNKIIDRLKAEFDKRNSNCVKESLSIVFEEHPVLGYGNFEQINSSLGDRDKYPRLSLMYLVPYAVNCSDLKTSPIIKAFRKFY